MQHFLHPLALGIRLGWGLKDFCNFVKTIFPDLAFICRHLVRTIRVVLHRIYTVVCAVNRLNAQSVPQFEQ